MLQLTLVTLIWAFSFGLIKGRLTGLDAGFVALVRLAISLLVFLPLLRPAQTEKPLRIRLIFIGGLQYGIMYLTYIYAYQFLSAWQVALFTIFTPLYISFFYDLLKKRFHSRILYSALLGVAGLAVIIYRNPGNSGLLMGFILMQISNLAFAGGQILYKELLSAHSDLKDQHLFAWLYLGGVGITLPAVLISAHWSQMIPDAGQWLTLLYLGVVASGLGFFLWNAGARRTNAGTLAVFNNLKVPSAMLVSLLVFGESAPMMRLLIGTAILLLALWYSQHSSSQSI